jgi:hypothetical protein
MEQYMPHKRLLDVASAVLATMGLDETVIDTLNLTLTTVGRFFDFVNVELLAGASDQSRLITSKLKSYYEHELNNQGFKELLFVVRATNIGRRAIDISRWQILTSKGWGYSLAEFRLNPKLPYRLEPGSVVEFYVPMQQMFAALYAAHALRGPVGQIRGSIRLGTGAVRRSKVHKLARTEPHRSESALGAVSKYRTSQSSLSISAEL